MATLSLKLVILNTSLHISRVLLYTFIKKIMKKLLLIALLFTACKPSMTTVKKENINFTFNPKVWKIVEFTKEDSIIYKSIINNDKK